MSAPDPANAPATAPAAPATLADFVKTPCLVLGGTTYILTAPDRTGQYNLHRDLEKLREQAADTQRKTAFQTVIASLADVPADMREAAMKQAVGLLIGKGDPGDGPALGSLILTPAGCIALIHAFTRVGYSHEPNALTKEKLAQLITEANVADVLAQLSSGPSGEAAAVA